MLTVDKEPEILKLIWRYEKCGKNEILVENQSQSFVACSFDPPISMECCGGTEAIGNVEATVLEDGKVQIMV